MLQWFSHIWAGAGRQMRSLFLSHVEISPARRKGQVAVVLVILAAVGLLLYALVFYFGRVSYGKTLAIRASNTTAAQMASFMASYGEKILQEELGGEPKKCKWSGLLASLLAIVIAVVIIMIDPLWATQAIQFALGVMAALSAISLVLQISIIEPAFTSSFNDAMIHKMLADSMSLQDRIIENGVQNGLRQAVTDQVQIPDLYDLDGDGIYGLQGSTPQDEISRFSFYLTERIRNIDIPALDAIEEFIKALQEFFYEGEDQWGLRDPVLCENYDADTNPHPCCPADKVTAGNYPALCDPCCYPDYYRDENGNLILDSKGEPIRLRPECCDSESNPCGNPDTCLQRSPYRHGAVGYDMVWQPFYDDSLNEFRSFREQWGRDDEIYLGAVTNQTTGIDARWYSRVATPQVLRVPTPDPGSDLVERFFLEDVVGYFSPPHFNDTEVAAYDDRGPRGNEAIGLSRGPGIYPLFYKMKDWGGSLADWLPDSEALTYGLNPSEPEKRVQCHWCDAGGPVGSCDTLPPELAPRLTLPDAPRLYNGDWCVDEENTTASGGPQLADNVRQPEAFYVPDSECAVVDENIKGWKRGADRFCKAPGQAINLFPYEAGCAKHAGMEGCLFDIDGEGVPSECGCGEGPAHPVLWPDDALDNVMYGLEDFFRWGDELMEHDILFLALHFKEWFPDAAQWLEPAPDRAASGGYLRFTDDPEADEEWLWKGRDALGIMSKPWAEWLVPRETPPYVSTACNNAEDPEGSVWCVPPTGQDPTLNADSLPECPGVTASKQVDVPGVGPDERIGEVTTFDYNENGIRGDLEDVVECLRWNVFDAHWGVDKETWGQPKLVTGNSEKFEICAEYCNEANCASLPRSLVPDMPMYEPPIEDFQLFFQCLMTGDNYYSGGLTGPIYNQATGEIVLPEGMEDVPGTIQYECGGNDEDPGDTCAWVQVGSPDSCPVALVNPGAPCNCTDPNEIGRVGSFIGPCVEVACQPSPSGNPNPTGGGINKPISIVWEPVVNKMAADVDACWNNCRPESEGGPLPEVDEEGAPYDMTPWEDLEMAPEPFSDETVAGLLVRAREICQGQEPSIPPPEGCPDWAAAEYAGLSPGFTCPSERSSHIISCLDYVTNPKKFRDDVIHCARVSFGSCMGFYWSFPEAYPCWDTNNSCDRIYVDKLIAIYGTYYGLDPAQAVDLLKCVKHTNAHLTPQEECVIECSPSAIPWAYKPPYDLPPWDEALACGENGPSDFLRDFIERFFEGGSCADFSDDGFLELAAESAEEARNQVGTTEHREQGFVLKFEKRFDFLANRLSEGRYAYHDNEADDRFPDGVMRTGIHKFTEFLEGPAQDLIRARIELQDTPPTESVGVYAWRDRLLEPRTLSDGTQTYDGEWHAVKVEVRSPGRCEVGGSGCAVGGVAPDPEWPRAKTYSKNWGTSRCYELINTEGLVKVRVIRFDEYPDAAGTFKLPGGLALFPEQPKPDMATVEGVCAQKIHPDLQGKPYGWAFMLNEPGGGCWDHVHNHMLRFGAESETCAVYFLGGGSSELGRTGMRLKFVPCDAGFTSGL